MTDQKLEEINTYLSENRELLPYRVSSYLEWCMAVIRIQDKILNQVSKDMKIVDREDVVLDDGIDRLGVYKKKQ